MLNVCRLESVGQPGKIELDLGRRVDWNGLIVNFGGIEPCALKGRQAGKVLLNLGRVENRKSVVSIRIADNAEVAVVNENAITQTVMIS